MKNTEELSVYPPTTSTADDRDIRRNSSSSSSSNSSVEIHEQHEKRQHFGQSETHYEMIWKIWKKLFNDMENIEEKQGEKLKDMENMEEK
jgi:hypothetical protein